ncbi:hypothetical protein BZZ01_04965 [Nostocales cyanobacterium HT-58-2]|nr:hypothetical protein BZZ01_04965 [Nostocales cyanobacterium HT-58-2]
MLRDEIIAYHQTHTCKGQSSKPLLIRAPIALIEQLNPQYKHLDLFDTSAYDTTDTADYLYLRLHPDYDVENDRLGDKGLRNTFSSAAVFATVNTRRGFKAIVKDRRKLVLDLIKRLVDISESSAYNRYTPIKLVDFCHPEVDAPIYNGEPATIRWGAIALDANLPSLVRVGSEDYFKKDWGFTFKESILRLN